jgi:dTDP-4-dehydrorhamnose reductase
MVSVVVLGGSGMLGSMVVDVLARRPGLHVAATVRTAQLAGCCRTRVPNVDWVVYDANDAPESVVAGSDYVVNAIGVIKPYIHDACAAEVERAIRVNALFPHRLAQATDAPVVQIATDCVYSGAAGGYAEDSPQDGLDAYGKTKALGEVPAKCMHHLRCSIIGPEAKGARSLLEWFLGQPHGAKLNGYVNHLWNGVTTLHFARVVAGVIDHEIALTPLQHIVPADIITKANLLACLARSYGRDDLIIQPTDAPVAVDRTLRTEDPELNARLWQAAGYDIPPTIEQMIAELAAWDYRFRDLSNTPNIEEAHG